jgi:ubiquinone/menaquinone biosynthesis C-methylase UbiE
VTEPCGHPGTLYDTIGRGYDETRRADPGLAERLASHLQLGPGAGPPLLDVACGSGNYTVALSRRGGRWTGVDQSWQMLRTARDKSREITWCRADATRMPFADESFGGAVCVLAIHHFAELETVFREIRRVVSRRLVLFTATKEQMEGFWLNHYFPDAMKRTIDHRLSEPSLTRSLERSGWRISSLDPYEVQPQLCDHFLYSGKHRPRIYLSPMIRSGMSTFAQLADSAEVTSGCSQLEADIATGAIERVMARYLGHDRGDYLFVACSGD